MTRTVLLDMGGVLVRLGGEQSFLDMIGSGIAADEMWRQWLASPAVRAHETGRMDSRDFAEEAVREFGLSVGAAEFLAHFTAWMESPFDGAHALLEDLSRRHRTAIVTNISAVHWPRAQSFGLFDRVERVFASHHIGAVKPDRDFFAIALAGMGAGPGDAVFLDDNVVNVQGARDCGIEAHVVRGLDETRAKLVALGLLPG